MKRDGILRTWVLPAAAVFLCDSNVDDITLLNVGLTTERGKHLEFCNVNQGVKNEFSKNVLHARISIFFNFYYYYYLLHLADMTRYHYF